MPIDPDAPNPQERLRRAAVNFKAAAEQVRKAAEEIEEGRCPELRRIAHAASALAGECCLAADVTNPD